MESKIDYNKDHEKGFDYFLLIGLSNEDVNENKTLNELINTKPRVISMFPDIQLNNNEIEDSENKSNESIINIKNLVESNEILKIIFPIKSDYLSSLNYDDLEDIDVQKEAYVDYLEKSSYRPFPFYHCFSQLFFINENFYLHLHFGVYIFYEEIKVKSNSSSLEEKVIIGLNLLNLKKSEDKVYAAKALVICGYNPYYILFKLILEEIYKLYLEPLEQPLELAVINLYTKLFHDQNKTLKLSLMNNNYFLPSNMFLQVYDLNLSAFFKRFLFDSFLIIAEHFLKRWPILMFSKDPTILYPTYFTIMNLIYPLNITNVNDFYKYLTPDIFQKVIPTAMAAFVCINSKIINDDKIKSIVKTRKSTTLIIDLDNKSLKIFKYDPDNQPEVTIHNEEEFYHRSIIKYIWNKNVKEDILFELLENNIYQLKKSKKSSNDYFQYINPESHVKEFNLINTIRKSFFSLFSKFLSFNIPYTEFSIKSQKNSEYTSYLIEIDFSDKIEDVFIQGFFSEFKLTPSFNVVYKNKCDPKDKNLQNIILLEELIKIIKHDKRRLYFDECLSFTEESIVNAKTLVINTKNIFFSIESDEALEVYKINKLKSLNYLGYTLNLIDKDKYCINYSHLNLFFKNFNSILDESIESKNLNQIISSHNLHKKDVNIIITEIEVFVHLVKTRTLYINKMKLIIIASYVVLLSIEFFTINNREEKIKKFTSIYQLFLESKGFGNKITFLISVIYKIICSDILLRTNMELKFLNKLQEFKIIPSFYVYLRSNNENLQDKENYGNLSTKTNFRRMFSEKNIFRSMLYQDITCLCLSKEIQFENISYINMNSLKCIGCKDTDCYFCILKLNIISGDKEYESFLIHPMIILIEILEKIIQNGIFSLDEKSLLLLLDPIENEKTRSLFFMINQESINLNILFEF